MPFDRDIRILHLEDDADFTEYISALLQQEGYRTIIRRVASKSEFEKELTQDTFDAILADYQLPDYTGLEALTLARGKCPETPFLLVSGTIGEAAAIDSLKNGATDYVLKLWPERLIPTLRRALQETEERRQRLQAQTELFRREKYFRALTENSLDILTILNREAVYLFNSPAVKTVLGYEPSQLAGLNALSFVHPDDLPGVRDVLQTGLQNPDKSVRLEFRFRHRDGNWRYLEAVGQNRLDDPDIAGLVVNSRDVTDRKRAEEALRDSEKQYRLIFDGNATPMWIFDRETLGFLEVNDSALRHYGYSRADFLQMTLRDVARPAEAAGWLEHVRRVMAEGAATTPFGFAGIWRHLKKDGTSMDVEVRWSAICFQGRRAVLSMVNDITERKRSEDRDAAFSKLGQKLSSATCPPEAARIIQTISEDLFRWDAFTLDLYDAEQDRILPVLNVDTDRQGKRFEIVPRPGGIEPSGMARRIMNDGAELVLRQEPVVMPSDVRPIGDVARPSASLALVPIRNRTKVIGILSIQSYSPNAYCQRDVSVLQTLADHCGGALERLRAEQAFHETERLFHSVWENSADGMRLTDEHGSIVAVNDAFCRLMGLPRQELEGKPFPVSMADSEERERRLEEYRIRFRNRTVENQVERPIRLHDGREVFLQSTNSFVELPGRSPLLLALFRDVTAQKGLEEQLRHAQKMEAVGQLAGGVAHDFNNILTIIHGHASLLLAGAVPGGDAARSAQQVARAADRAAALTRQLLAFSRRQVMQTRRLDVNEVVRNLSKMLARTLREDITLQLHHTPHPLVVEADAGMLEQVLLNLAVNARDAMAQGGMLTIRISARTVDAQHGARHSDAKEGRFACLTVTDTGCGIAPENLRRIFEPFFTTKEVGKGTGLGLATAYGIVQQHQGWIEVASQPGQGTTFEVFLPCLNQAAAGSDIKAVSRPVRGGPETIMVVEDETAVRELVCHLLSSYGYKILQAASGAKALEVWHACKDQIDLVLTDLVMPDRINGRELAQRLLADRPQLKVVFTSGYGADIVGKDLAASTDFRYLQKPYHPDKLALVVRDALDAVN